MTRVATYEPETWGYLARVRHYARIFRFIEHYSEPEAWRMARWWVEHGFYGDGAPPPCQSPALVRR